MVLFMDKKVWRESMKLFIRNLLFFSAIVFVFQLVFAKEIELLLFIATSLVLGTTAAVGIEQGRAKLKAKENGKKYSAAQNRSTPKATTPKPIYISKPVDNGFIYRIEWQHGRQYVFEGNSNRFIYRIEGDKIYRGSETKVYYQLKGNKVYRAFDYKDPVYRIDGDKIYQGNFGTRPVFTIGSRSVR